MMGVVLLGERPGLGALAALALILSGIGLSELGNRRMIRRERPSERLKPENRDARCDRRRRHRLDLRGGCAGRQTRARRRSGRVEPRPAPWPASQRRCLRTASRRAGSTPSQRCFALCKVQPGEAVAILSESQSRPLNVELAELALLRLGARPFQLRVPTPAADGAGAGALDRRLARAAGASARRSRRSPRAGLVVDLTRRGPAARAGAAGDPRAGRAGADGQQRASRGARAPGAATRRSRRRSGTRSSSPGSRRDAGRLGRRHRPHDRSAGGAASPGVWGWCDRPGTVAHWPGGLVVAFPKAGSVNGTLVLDPGDVNLTFKRYLESRVTLADRARPRRRDRRARAPMPS